MTMARRDKTTVHGESDISGEHAKMCANECELVTRARLSRNATPYANMRTCEVVYDVFAVAVAAAATIAVNTRKAKCGQTKDETRPRNGNANDE